MVNGSRFGNGTSIFTESGAAVRRYRHDVEAGMVGVNIGVAAPVAFFPFSGWKDSLPRRPARPRPRRGRLLHPQEDRHQPLLLERRVRQLLRRELNSFVRSEGFRRGLRQGAPFAVAGGILAISFGILAVESGFSPALATVFSAIVFAGSAQFASISIVGAGGGAGPR